MSARITSQEVGSGVRPRNRFSGLYGRTSVIAAPESLRAEAVY